MTQVKRSSSSAAAAAATTAVRRKSPLTKNLQICKKNWKGILFFLAVGIILLHQGLLSANVITTTTSTSIDSTTKSTLPLDEQAFFQQPQQSQNQNQKQNSNTNKVNNDNQNKFTQHPNQNNGRITTNTDTGSSARISIDYMNELRNMAILSSSPEQVIKTWNWLCPNKVPNMEATGKVFQLAQEVFYKDNVGKQRKRIKRLLVPNNGRHDNNDESDHNNVVPPSYDPILTKKYFSHWPGQAAYTETGTGKVATFLRTWKCGSKSIQQYLQQNAKHFEGKKGKFGTSLSWYHFPKYPSCIISSFRDPISHFISGIGEIEARYGSRRKRRQKNNKNNKVDRFDVYPVGTEERFIAFVDFLLRYEWDSDGITSDFRHVFPQSGHLYTLNTINQTITRFISMKNLAVETLDSLNNTCGISDVMEPPERKALHRKVAGLEDFLKQLWTNTTTTTTTTTTDGQTLKNKQKVITSFETICLLDVIDYACLATELQVPPPEFCMKVYDQHLFSRQAL